jgi:phage terminase large subunit-like protein
LAAFALWHEKVRVAVIAPTFADARDVCVEGESGLLRLIPPACLSAWHRSTGDILLFNGSRIKLFSADQPERLRGPQHHRVWCDEVGAWPTRGAFDQMLFGLRLGADPRVVITTTPRGTELVRELVARAGQDVFLTRGRTFDNVGNLAPFVLDRLMARYAGTRLGRQELEAELLDDCEDALWKRVALDAARVVVAPPLMRVVVAIDPAMSHGGSSDETGLVAAGRGSDGLFYVLGDGSGRYAPDVWARRAAAMSREYGTALVVAEVNAGGELVERVLRQVAPEVRYKPVRAVRGKMERAFPIAALYEQGRVRHVGALPQLEDQMCRFSEAGLAEKSPDRVDALVWALTELSEGARGEPRVRAL